MAMKQSTNALVVAEPSPAKIGMEVIKTARQVKRLWQELDELCGPLPRDARPEDVIARSEANRLDVLPRELVNATILSNLAIIKQCKQQRPAFDAETAQAKADFEAASQAEVEASRVRYAAHLRYIGLGSKGNRLFQCQRDAENGNQYLMRLSPDAVSRIPEQRRERLEYLEMLKRSDFPIGS